MKKRLAIFDLDGTLFDTDEANFKAYHQALAEENVTLTSDYFYNFCIGKNYKTFLPAILPEPSECLIERIHKKKKRYYQRYYSTVRENENLFAFLLLCKKEFYCALVTTASKENCEGLLSHFNRTSLFDAVIAAEDVSKLKPDPEGFLLAIEKFGVTAKDTVIFEDSEVGLAAARQTGATVFAVCSF